MKSILLGGALALVATAAFAASNVHTMTVQLPGGGVERIAYTGDTAPRVTVEPGAAAFTDPFAEFDRIAAMMDRQMAAMQAQMLEARAAAGNRQSPNGFFIATHGGHGFCAEMTQVTIINGKREVHSSTQGDCGGGNAAVAAPRPENQAIPIKLTKPVAPAHKATI